VARSYRYLDALTVSFVVILLISNLLAQKIIRFGAYVDLRVRGDLAGFGNSYHLRCCLK
jgi:hypothetical protein